MFLNYNFHKTSISSQYFKLKIAFLIFFIYTNFKQNKNMQYTCGKVTFFYIVLKNKENEPPNPISQPDYRRILCDST